MVTLLVRVTHTLYYGSLKSPSVPVGLFHCRFSPSISLAFPTAIIPPMGGLERILLSQRSTQRCSLSEKTHGISTDNKMLIQLYCMNGGYHLRILEDGTVEGKRDGNDIYSKVAPIFIFVPKVVFDA